MKYFLKKITGPWNIQVYGLLGYKNLFKKFVKPSALAPLPPTYLMYAPLGKLCLIDNFKLIVSWLILSLSSFCLAT